MKKFISLIILTLISLSGFAQKDEFVGFYKGDIVGLSKIPWDLTRTVYGEVYRVKDEYRLRLVGHIFSRCTNYFIKEGLKANDGVINFSGGGRLSVSKGTITPESITIVGKSTKTDITLNMTRYNPPQSTLGQKAPDGATVIFDGTSTDNLEFKGAKPCTLEIVDGAIAIDPKIKGAKDGAVVRSSVYTKESFAGAFKLHVEFMCPADSYHLLGQQRNNSGIYLGDYEVQVLDSFGLESLWDDCGAIYKQVAPYRNACLEPGAWQTYDITFYPAEFEGNKLVKNPRVTVYQNDIKVQHETEIETATAGAASDPDKYKHPNKALKIMLQEHKNKVQFRNIWIEKL
ncbi:MAG: DUF1080 domain-containing protein [Opitutales bacterium]